MFSPEKNNKMLFDAVQWSYLLQFSLVFGVWCMHGALSLVHGVWFVLQLSMVYGAS